MSLPPPPANGNHAAFCCAPWAAWSAEGFRAWGAITAASLDTLLCVQRAWFEAGQDLLRRHHATVRAVAERPGVGPQETPVMLAATLEDLRECGSAVAHAQAEALESWRHSA